MHTAAESARVGERRIRALLESDRRAASESRRRLEPMTLRTGDYKAPLRVRLKRSFHEDARVRLGGLIASASLVLALVAGLANVLGTARASQAGARAQTLASPDTARARSATLPISHHPLAPPGHETASEPQGPLNRLDQARQPLSAPGPEGAAKARALLEDLLRAQPKNGRAWAALSEACLRLEDAACARHAVAKAVARQPRRAKYKELAARIESAFAQPQP